MVKKFDREYDINDFKNFASNMNNAARIDSPAVLPQSTVTNANKFTPITTGGGRAFFGDTVNNFKSYLKSTADGQSSPYLPPLRTAPVSSGTETKAPSLINGDSGLLKGNNTADTVVPGSATTVGNESETTVVPGVPDTVNEIGGEVVADADKIGGGTDFPGASVSDTTVPDTTVPDTSGNPKSYEDWRAEFGIDSETEFNNAKAQLEYEMRTWAANYGANAERLAQMGLSNSGVVDIYGTGVVQAYVSAMNDLFYAKIQTEKDNKTNYQTYLDKYEADKAARTETFNNNVTAAYSYGLSIYDGNNIDAVRTMIINAGYDEDVANAAVERLSAVDASMNPVLRQKQTTITQAYSLGLNYYDGYNIDAVKTMLKNAGYDEDVVNAAAERLASVDDSMNPTLQSELASVAETLLAMGYTSGDEDSIRANYASLGWSDNKINALIKQLNALSGLSTTLGGTTKRYTYTDKNGAEVTLGTKESAMVDELKEAFNTFIASTGTYNETAVREIAKQKGITDENVINVALSQLEEEQKSNNTLAASIVEDAIGNTSVETLSISDLDNQMLSAKQTYGKDSDEYKAIQAKASAKYIELLEYALDSYPDGTAKRLTDEQTLTQLGIDPAAVADKDGNVDAALIESTIMEKAADLACKGYLTEDNYSGFVSGWVDGEMEKYIADEKKNARASGFNDAASIVQCLSEWLGKGALTDEQYKKQLDSIIDGFDFKFTKGWQISWLPDTGSEATLKPHDCKTIADDDEISAKLGNAVCVNAAYEKIALYDGKLYLYKRNDASEALLSQNTYGSTDTSFYWQTIGYFSLDGDGANNAAFKEGIYDIVVRMLEKKEEQEKQQ